jgi:hypothetical protein
VLQPRYPDRVFASVSGCLPGVVKDMLSNTRTVVHPDVPNLLHGLHT